VEEEKKGAVFRASFVSGRQQFDPIYARALRHSVVP
jgi:hypothetical protein